MQRPTLMGVLGCVSACIDQAPAGDPLGLRVQQVRCVDSRSPTSRCCVVNGRHVWPFEPCLHTLYLRRSKHVCANQLPLHSPLHLPAASSALLTPGVLLLRVTLRHGFVVHLGAQGFAVGTELMHVARACVVWFI
jgi:hypothetical protein